MRDVGSSNSLLRGFSGPAQTFQRRAERLATAQHGLEELAVLLHPLEGFAASEVGRPDAVGQLLPPERRRYRCSVLRPHRVHRRDRLAVPVLPVVDEDASPLLLQPLRRDETGVLLLETARE